MKIYLVGGAVRDKLLGLPVKERDWVVVGATPEQMIALGYRPVGRDFPVFLHPKTNEEYALARTERKSGRGYQGFVFNTGRDVTLEQDLIRRDITINAIAETEAGEIIDPYGGQEDLKKRQLRHISDAFVEDPVRLLRVARFVAKFEKFNFKVADETMVLLRHMVDNGEVSHLVAERVWQELYKALQEAHPSQFFRVLKACGADKVIFPAIDDSLHAMKALDIAAQLSSSPKIRFATLYSLKTPFYDALKVPKDYKELAILVGKYHKLCHDVFDLKSEAVVNLLERVDAFRRESRFHEFLIACEADAKGKLNCDEYPQSNYLLRAHQACKVITAKPFLAKGINGIELANAIHQARVQVMDALN